MNIIQPVKTMASISTLCLLLAFSSMSIANESNDDIAFNAPKHLQKGGDRREHMMKRMVNTLSLSEQQQVQITAVKHQARQQHEMLRDSMKKFKAEEKALLQAQVFDKQAYSVLHAAYQPIFMELALIRAKTKHTVFNVLTTAQQGKWLKVMADKKGKFNNKRG